MRAANATNIRVSAATRRKIERISRLQKRTLGVVVEIATDDYLRRLSGNDATAVPSPAPPENSNN